MTNESFVDFKNSFSYGTRSDLNFKFLKGLSEEETAVFFQDLLTKLGDTIDDGNVERLIDHVVAAQRQGYSQPTAWSYDEGVLMRLAKPVSEMRMGLLTSTGHFLADEDPEPFGVKGMTQHEAMMRIGDFLREAPELSAIPLETSPEQMRVRHGGYDIHGVQADRNVALPLDRMRELDEEGIVGTAVSPAYSFVGAAAQRRLLSQSAPAWLETFQQQKVEGAILVPV